MMEMGNYGRKRISHKKRKKQKTGNEFCYASYVFLVVKVNAFGIGIISRKGNGHKKRKKQKTKMHF
jgi:hypothetical protein